MLLISAFAAEIFMYQFEKHALATFAHPPEIWSRYVDDTKTKFKIIHTPLFLAHLNSFDERLQFTEELMDQETRTSKYLDVKTKVKEDGSLIFDIFRKPTHTDQYLNFKSNHHANHKIGLVSTLRHRKENIITEEEDKIKEDDHIKKVLKVNNYPDWALKERKKKPPKTTEEEEEENRGRIMIPYLKGISEKIAREFKRYNITTIHKPVQKLKQSVCNMKDRIDPLDRSCVVYKFDCKPCKPIRNYVGHTKNPLKERGYQHHAVNHNDRTKNHPIPQINEEEIPLNITTRRSTRLKEKPKVNYKKMNSGEQSKLTEGNTEISKHITAAGHTEGDWEFKIISHQPIKSRRIIREAIEIKKRSPNLNLDDSYKLPKIYDLILKPNPNL